MSPFEALLRFAFVDDEHAWKVIQEFCSNVAARRHDAAELATDAAYKLASNSSRARVIVYRLAQRNGALDEALARTREGALPELSPAALDACNAQLSKYTTQIVSRARIDAWRKAKRRKEVEPVEGGRDLAVAAKGTDLEDSGLLKVAKMVDDSIKADRQREPWLDEAIDQVTRLARGDVSMDELTQACIEGDPPAFTGLAPNEARKRGRNRLQKRHQRARERLAAEAQGMVSLGRLTEDEGRMAEEYVVLLMRRRQKRRGPPSGGLS